MAGRAGIWLTAKKLHIGLDKTSPICYNKGIKGKGNANMMNFEVYSLLRKCLDDGTFTGMDVFQAERACQKFEEA